MIKHFTSFLFIFLLSASLLEVFPQKGIVANPINLNYRFQLDEPSRREAADPVCEYFNGKYYLFASKSGGYWSSEDLTSWTYIPNTTILTQENYAPTILVQDNRMYYLIGGSPRIFYTDNPDVDNWKELNTRFEYGTADPAFFKDEDTGRVYIYWGCSDKDPIMGVEVDPANGFKSIGKPVELIQHHSAQYGWEVSGQNNDRNYDGWNEGPCMLKHNGKYYLQYAAPGTEFRVYGDGVYVADDPLGPFTYRENSPFSFKPGGFIGGAGHGHTFKDKYGNYWHVSTMTLSVRQAFERRLGLFPVYFSEDGNMFCHAVWTDYPFQIPDEKTDFEKNNLSVEWNLLSYGKTVSASSTYRNYIAGNATDEKIETWWSAQTGNTGEWWQIDLEKPVRVNAIQVNLADQDFMVLGNPFSYVYYQYKIESSDDGQTWKMFIDRTQNTKDMPHELIVLDNPETVRYLRITNTKVLDGKFSLSGFRVFGSTGGELPQEVTGLLAKRQNADPRRFQINWDKQDNVTGYIVRWGVREDQMNNATMVFTNSLEAGYFNRDSKYYFSVDAFNESGVATGKSIQEGFIYLGSPYGGTPWDVPGTIEAEDFNEGGQGYGYYDTTVGNFFLKYRLNDYVDIAQDRRSGVFYIDNTATGEFLNYTINVTETGTYDFECVGALSQDGQEGGFYLSFDGEDILNPVITKLEYGAKPEFKTTTLTGIELTKGIHVMTFNIEGKICVDKFHFIKEGTGIKGLKQNLLNIYPNPSNGVFYVQLPQKGLLSVADMNGRNIYSEYEENLSTMIGASDFPKGIYILSFVSENQNERIKLIKN